MSNISTPSIYIGIDPGKDGGIAILSGNSKVPRLIKLNGATEKSIWELLLDHSPADWFDRNRTYCILEEITPRPTHFLDKRTGKWTSSILKSTCLIYGNYCLLRGMLHGAGIPFEEKLPQVWLKEFNLSSRKGESKVQWKNRLKAKAQQLFPMVKITLAVADALLLAEYARRNHSPTSLEVSKDG